MKLKSYLLSTISLGNKGKINNLFEKTNLINGLVIEWNINTLGVYSALLHEVLGEWQMGKRELQFRCSTIRLIRVPLFAIWAAIVILKSCIRMLRKKNNSLL